MQDHSKYGIGTKAIHAGQVPDEYGSATPAIYQTSTFVFDTAAQGAARFKGEEDGYIYTRLGNPTNRMLEDNIAAMENGVGALSCSSGMAATNTLFFALLGSGSHIVMGDALYGPSRTVVENHWSRFGVEASFVDCGDLEAVRAAMRPETKLLFLESPANPTLAISDIRGCSEIAHQHGALLCVDNTFMSPILQRPLELGADIVMHSVTKFLNGHSDVVGGILVFKDEELLKQVRPVWFNLGGTMDPHQSWLVLRGTKTLRLRVLAAQTNALELANFIEGHQAVGRVDYPGLDQHPRKALHDSQASGPGSLISFELKGGLKAGAKLMDSLNLMKLAVSLGGVETLICHAASTTHASMSRESRLAAGITDGLVRLSVGCEEVSDLLDDLQQAFAELN